MRKIQLPWIALLLFGLCVTASAQKRGGGGGGGGNPPPSEESTTNLSYPAYFYGTSQLAGTIGSYTLGATVVGDGMSYGCLVPETIETTTFPNTSCVHMDLSGGTVYEDYAACSARCQALDTAAVVERIYWQKDLRNKWQAGYTSTEKTLATALPVDYIDWGDNLEGRTWPVQVLRVETNTFSTLPVPDPTMDPNWRLRFELWHVFGMGTNELWGVHATANPSTPIEGEDPTDDFGGGGIPYVYLDTTGLPNWPYAVNNAPGVRLNIAKLQAEAITCPTTGTGLTQLPSTYPSFTWYFDDVANKGRWQYPNPDGFTDVPYFTDNLYGAELNIKGSYVYGYNWDLRSEATIGVLKGGWWRLTFYTPKRSDGTYPIDFTNFLYPTDPLILTTLAPPGDAAAPGTLSTSEVLPAAEEEGDTGGQLYVPQVDYTNQLTYLDICIQDKAGGGGKRR